jgi:uncharacterized protein (TIGR02145 family)
MKKFIIVLMLIFITQSAFSQKIVLHRNAGGDQTYQLSSVDSISFSPFVCGDEIRYEGKTYGTVLIGTQCWMKKNLDVGTMIEGPSISPAGKQTNNQIIEKYCYDNDTANCSTYGGLYEWNEAMQYVTTSGTKGICPDGWHIPTSAEFQTLSATVNYDADALKDLSINGGTNASGFSALYAGYVYYVFENLNFGAWWWSSTDYTNSAEAEYLTIGSSWGILFYSNWKWYGISVRCLKDQ